MKKILLILLCGVALNCNAQHDYSKVQKEYIIKLDSQANFQPYFIFNKKDTIPAYFLVSSTSTNQNYIRFQTNTDSGYYDCAKITYFIDGFVVRYHYEELIYLNEIDFPEQYLNKNKKPFSKDIIIWDYKLNH